MPRLVSIHVDDTEDGKSTGKGVFVVSDYREALGALRGLFAGDDSGLGKCFECGHDLSVYCPKCNE